MISEIVVPTHLPAGIHLSESTTFDRQAFLLTPGGEDYVGVNSYDDHAGAR